MDPDDTLAADETAEAASLVFRMGLIVVRHPVPGLVGRRLIPELGVDRVLGRGRDTLGPGGLDDARVSRRHTAVRAVGPQVQVVDLDSRNGTWVNGERVESRVLGVGDVVRVGPLLFVCQAIGGQGPARPHPRLLGVSGELGRVLESVERVGPLDATVLVLGPTGVGKELVARELHRASGRRGALVTINCAAMTDSILHSELFGHVRGAFTGAGQRREGLVAEARGGTLFLDEVGDASPALQATLLRLLEDRRVRPVGSDREAQIDLRFVAATNRDLREDVRLGRFREDLLARLSRYIIRVPALSHRREDVLPLARAFAARHAGHPVSLSGALSLLLLRYDWPGNVRELDNIMRRLVIDQPGVEPLGALPWTREELTPHAPRAPQSAPRGARWSGGPPPRDELAALLDKHQGNITAAARELGVGRNTFYRWLRRRELDPRGS